MIKVNNNDCGFENLQNLSNPTLESSLSICLPSFPNPGPTPILHPLCQDSFCSVLTYSLRIPYNIFDHIIPLLQLTYLPSWCHIFCLKKKKERKKIHKNTWSLVYVEFCWPTAPEHESCPGCFDRPIVTLLKKKTDFFSPFSAVINWE